MKDNLLEIVPTPLPINESTIKVIGVGGGGCNAVTRMYTEGKIQNVHFMICNTDMQALFSSPVEELLQLGTALTRGLGAGMDPERGRAAALESIEEIKKAIGDKTEMVFVTAGMGGGTGTGAAPVIAKIARDMGKLTIGVVTYPSNMEGKRTLQRAYDGLEEMSKCSDGIVIVDNQKMFEFYGDLTIEEAFKKADNVLDTAVRGIAQFITCKGTVNIDFADVRKVMKNSGMVLIGIGVAKGDDRATKAVERAFSSPLIKNFDLKTAKNLLVNIISHPKAMARASEATKILEEIKDYTGHNIEESKTGYVYDDTLEEGCLSVNIAATGFRIQTIAPPSSGPIVDPDGMIPLGGSHEPISDSPIETPTSIRSINLDEIAIYTSDINISDYENKPALQRRLELKKQNAHE